MSSTRARTTSRSLGLRLRVTRCQLRPSVRANDASLATLSVADYSNSLVLLKILRSEFRLFLSGTSLVSDADSLFDRSSSHILDIVSIDTRPGREAASQQRVNDLKLRWAENVTKMELEEDVEASPAERNTEELPASKYTSIHISMPVVLFRMILNLWRQREVCLHDDQTCCRGAADTDRLSSLGLLEPTRASPIFGRLVHPLLHSSHQRSCRSSRPHWCHHGERQRDRALS